jgi:NAD(P)-dependent dehydrogenase (short-subunit alcohol dehydrogenase family)
MIQKLFSLEGKKAMVVGGAGGLGRVQARALAGAGAQVAVCDLEAAACREVVRELEAQGGQGAAFGMDIRSKESVTRTAAQAMAEVGPIDILCNTAGVNYRVPLLEYPEEEWDRVLEINLKGIFLVSQAMVPRMIERGYGKVINMSSIMGRVTYFNQAAYCSSKGGVDQLTRVMALEWAKDGVRVNAISPTYIETPLVKKVLEEEPERVEYIQRRTPMGRLGRAEELMGLTIFLASPASDLMTGQSLCIDGGWTAW